PRSPFWIRGPNVILRRHLGMAREPALGAARIKFGRLKRVGRWIISPLGICPSVRIRESLGILFDERNRFQGVRYIYEIGRHIVPFEGPLDLRNFGTVREKLAIARHAVLICLYHRVIRRDYFQAGLGLTYCNVLPGFVSPELRKREPAAWYFQRVPVLRGNCFAAPDNERYRNGGTCSGDAHRGRVQKSAETLVDLCVGVARVHTSLLFRQFTLSGCSFSAALGAALDVPRDG